MERYLTLDNLNLALGNISALPSAEELQKLMGQAEIAMFARQTEIPDPLLKTAWYLHSLASSRKSLELYDLSRCRRAHQISSHIFDLVLQAGVTERSERLSYAFAAQIGYIRGGLAPNANAMYKAIKRDDVNGITLFDDNLALEIGTMLLALDRKALFTLLPGLLDEVRIYSHDAERSSITLLKDLLSGCWDLLLYLSYGREESLADAKRQLELIARNASELEDLNLRWVAAHLLDISDDFGKSSVWSILPEGIPSAAAKAMTLGTPPVLSLWPPQVRLLGVTDDSNPLLLSTKRLLLSFPTSAGKTLLAQFFVLSHLAQGSTGVCFVAPTHSLCREIRKSLNDRLRLLKKEVMQDMPIGFFDDFDISQAANDVEVMTPERLAFLLRNNLRETLDRFSLFVIDEAHLLTDESRGWGLEASLSLLHMLTKNTEHRIMLMSSALGNRSHLVQWVGIDDHTLTFHNEWRGPRRLYAIYSPTKSLRTEPETTIARTRHGEVTRYHYELDGILRIKVADTSELYTGRTQNKVGDLYTQPDRDGNYHPVQRLTTPFYKMLVPLILEVAESGPVLTIVSTRSDAQNLAKALADQISDESAKAESIASLASLRLGSEHLLSKVLEKGVAFHHAALPSDLQDAIESGVRNGSLKYLISTSTLVEGVNLPVRTVIIGNTGSYTREGFREFITGPKLINAIGRAGRAGKESEGWIILADRNYVPDRFNQLMQVRDEDVEIISRLTSEAVLNALSEAEEYLRDNEDGIFSLEHSDASDFLSYVWVVASALEDLNQEVEFVDIESFLKTTLGWQQLSEDQKSRITGLAQSSYDAFKNAPAESRKKWAKTGTSLPSAKTLDSFLIDSLMTALVDILQEERSLTPEESIEILLTPENLNILFSLPESPNTKFKSSRNAPRDSSIEVDYKLLLIDWMNGKELSELVDTYLSEVADKEYAYECLGDFITGVFEHYLPWILGTLINWANEYLFAVAGTSKIFSLQVPAYVRYGLNNPDAMDLMMNGVKSRILALEIAKQYSEEDEASLAHWLRQIGLNGIRDRFIVSESDLRDILGYLKPRESFLLAEIIDGIEVKLDFRIRSTTDISGEATFKYSEEDELPAKISLSRGDATICTLPLSAYVDIESLMETGLPYSVKISFDEDDLYGVSVKLIDYS